MNRAIIILLAAATAGADALHAQSDSVTAIAGERYRAGGLQRWLLGDNYREMWTTPVRIPVLDLEREKGGLTPVERTGQVQTPGLRFRAPDGSEHNFRALDKELTPALPPFIQETSVDWIRQDATSAQMPVAAIIVAPLLDAVGIMQPGPRLVVLPDDPRLGEFREEFAGRVGMIEAHPNEVREGVGGFGGSVEVEDTEGMLDELESDPRNRVDDRAFLTARLVDLLVGDWDRHPGQWRWARFDRGNTRVWVPVPEDRDYAFVDFGGKLMDGVRMAGGNRLVRFRDAIPPPEAMTANSLPLNRRLLAELPRPAWDSIARFVQSRLTDEVLAAAVARVPAELREQSEQTLLHRLRARRDALPRAAEDFYHFLAGWVEVDATDVDEVATIQRQADGALDVTIVTADGREVYRRRFVPAETHEVRIDLHGGNDRATVQGAGSSIVVRLIGGGGDDRLEALDPGPAYLYDSSGQNELLPGPDGRADRRTFDAPADSGALIPNLYRDWGSTTRIGPWADWRSNVGVVVGARARRVRYGFRTSPYAASHEARALVSPLNGRGALEYRGALHNENSGRWLELRGDATTMRALHFFGFGNDVDDTDAETRVWMRELSAEAYWHVPLSPTFELAPGLSVSYTNPRPDEGSPLEELQPFGYEALGQMWASTTLRHDSRDDLWYPTRGLTLEATVLAAPPVWDLDAAYSRIDAVATNYVGIPKIRKGTVLALRGGGAGVLGEFPFQASAFLGGTESVRGYEHERFAGDALIFGNAELRVPVTDVELLVRWKAGVSALADVGRVFLDGESPGGWHGAVGGAVWITTPMLAFSLTWAHGEDDRFYADIGLPFTRFRGTTLLR